MMPIPIHLYASVPLAVPAATAAQRLRNDPGDLAAAATASSLRVLAPQAERLGLRPSALPTVRARMTDADEPGVIEVVWEGEEEATGWPSLAGLLLATPAPGETSRLLLVSSRSPRAGLTTGRLERLHRLRLVELAVQRFVHDLAGELDARMLTAPSWSVARYDRSPLFVHDVRTTDHDPDQLYRALATDIAGRAERATATVIARHGATLAAGHFRSVPAPDVQGEVAAPGEPGAVRIRWRSDEEATGWPDIDLLVTVEAGPVGARLSVLSPREAGFDLSLNRIDKQQRDHLLRHAGAELASALLEELAVDVPAPRQGAADRAPALSGAGPGRGGVSGRA